MISLLSVCRRVQRPIPISALLHRRRCHVVKKASTVIIFIILLFLQIVTVYSIRIDLLCFSWIFIKLSTTKKLRNTGSVFHPEIV